MVLRSLSDQEILSRIHELTRRERSLTRLVLLHLNEIERRRLHLKLGYSSMFDYCTSGLGYSSSAAARRIRTARCITRFPEVFALLEANEVNLSTVSQVSRVLTTENKDGLLSRIRRRSQREVDAIVAEYEPRTTPPDRVRPVVVRVSTAGAAVPTITGSGESLPFSDGTLQPIEVTAERPDPGLAGECRPAGAGGEHCRSGSETSPNMVTEKRTLLSFSASEAFMVKLEKIKSLAWHRLPAKPSLEQVFELAMNLFIEKEDPAAHRERREARNERSQAKVDDKKENRSTGTQPPRMARPSHRRHVVASVKDEVFTRDEGRCSYVGATGRRCASTRALQVDHIKPVARGGESTPNNLRLLCAYHIQLEAERLLGKVGGARITATTDSTPTPRVPGSFRGHPSPAPT